MLKRNKLSEMVYIYVLRLEQGKYYVGRSDTPLKRIKEHFKGKGCRWTKLYSPIKVKKIIGNCDPFDEDKYTLKYMDRYGVMNVRGGSFSSLKLCGSTIKFIRKLLDGSRGRCYKCHNSGHFASTCMEEI